MYASTITVGNDVLEFTPQTLILYRGEPFIITDISPDDTVTIVALGSTIWLIEVAYGHGFLNFSNAQDILDGRIIIDPLGQGIHRFANLEDTITLPEGRYRVTVEGRNIEAFITEVEIRQGETTTVDLTEVEPSAAVLELTVTPHGSRVFINGEITSAHAALEFDFGAQVTIRVERDGYYTDERIVEMNQAVVSINITLEEETPEILYGMLFVSTTPAGAQIWISNQFIGVAPVSVELPIGRYTIVALAGGFHDYITDIDIVAGDNHRSITMNQIHVEPEYVPIPTTPPDEHDDYSSNDDY